MYKLLVTDGSEYLFDVPNKTFDLDTAIKNAVADYFATADGYRKLQDLAQGFSPEFSLGMLHNIPNSFFEKHGAKLLDIIVESHGGENILKDIVIGQNDGSQFKLSGDEYNALNKIAETTKMDCWFCLTDSSDETYDLVFDCEQELCLSLKVGIGMLADGIVEPIDDPMYGLSPDEIVAVANLFAKLGI